MASITILSRIGVSYYDSSLRQLYVMEVWEDGGEDFPLIDMGMCYSFYFIFQEKVSISLGVSPIFCGINWLYMFSFFLYLSFRVEAYLFWFHASFSLRSLCPVKYQAKPLIIYTSTKSEESFLTALQKNGMLLIACRLFNCQIVMDLFTL